MRTYKIKDLGKVITGKTPSTKVNIFWNSNDFPFICPPDIKNNRYISKSIKYISNYALNKFNSIKLKENSIVISCIGYIGYVSITKKLSISNQQINAITNINRNIVSELYLYYLLLTKKDYFNSIGQNGTTMPIINKTLFENIELSIHSIEQQHHIVNIMGTIDDLIEKKQVEFNQKVKYLLLLFDKFETKNVSVLDNVFKTFSGGIFENKYYVDSSKHKLITIKNVDDDGFNTKNVSYLSKEKANKKYLLSIGEMVLTMTGNIGRTGIVDEDECYLNQRLLKLSSQSSSYLFAYLQKYKKEIIQLGKGTAQLNLSLDDLKKLKVFNSYEEIVAFKKYDWIYNSLLNCKLVIKKAKQIKKILLSKYF
ncbi:restriction endonuclease subunit S [Metamycoplasma hyosynoviae]|uniref:restriction endonuclease subunit S n=1 Tax=Metamycoplasma hyosynoviae TaxID=29559 RepID=UPI002361C8D1|nr:restriction endonuclease subunit S [Metamycoplasma hyosynoviae]MDD1379248.1 restriction endonuclease subunit S [Metamycoplasma hyosynoviae]